MTVKTLKLDGRLDSAAAARLEPDFSHAADSLAEREDKAIIDLQDLIYISSMGIRLLVSTIKAFRRRGIEFATVRPKDSAATELLITVDLLDHLNMVEDAEAAHAQVHEIWKR